MDKLWLVWIPSEEFPRMFTSREEAAKQADMVARLNVGAEVHLYQLKSVGSIKYPDSPMILGDMMRVRQS